jgi:hypothetical protein
MTTYALFLLGDKFFGVNIEYQYILYFSLLSKIWHVALNTVIYFNIIGEMGGNYEIENS